MAKYRFRLQTLQKLRELHRDELQGRLAEALRAEEIVRNQIKAVHTEIVEAQAAQRAQLQSPITNMNSLLSMQRYQAVLRTQLTTLGNQSQVLAAEAEKRRQAVVEADKQVRLLERLHDRQLAAHRYQEQLAETKLMDEIASTRQEVDS